MDVLTSSIEEALKEVDKLLVLIKKGKSVQVKSADEKSVAKINALAWFNNYQPKLRELLNDSNIFSSVNQSFSTLLEFTDRTSTRSRYLDVIKSIKMELLKIRSYCVTQDPVNVFRKNAASVKPDFVKLISDQKMRNILERRWDETQQCLNARAYLAATVMMGALLEALLLARINHMAKKDPIFKLKSTPKDRKTGKPKPLPEWMLNDFIQVASEMQWIRQSAQQVGVVLRDYRNFIHPERELSTGITIEEKDAKMFWAIFEQLSHQILASIK